ncbi:MAG: hypothetical protein OXD37_06820 [Acidimicrobiaceae bacterium]|nr:hypothetical protein [Acidimicrobiaceae bacterium]
MDAERVLMIRLGPWVAASYEIEPGYVALGYGYRYGMSQRELVDSMRMWWRINPARVEWEGIQHAVAAHRGITRIVVEIGDWIQAPIGPEYGRWSFTATPITSGPVHDKWVGPSGRRIQFKRGSQSPVLYWPPR